MADEIKWHKWPNAPGRGKRLTREDLFHLLFGLQKVQEYITDIRDLGFLTEESAIVLGQDYINWIDAEIHELNPKGPLY